MGRLCVELAEVRAAGTAWPQGIDIGCTELPPDPIAPMCEQSVILFKNKDGAGDEERSPIGKDDDYKTLIKQKEKRRKNFCRL